MPESGLAWLFMLPRAHPNCSLLILSCDLTHKGCVVAVKTTDGTVYEGVLRAVSPNMDVSLNAAYDKSKVCCVVSNVSCCV